MKVEPPPALDEEQRTLPGPDYGTRLALQDVHATLGEFLALALPYVEESDMQKLADAVFSRFDAIIAAARPAQIGERVLSAAETRQCVGKTMLNGLRARGFGDAHS